MTERAAAAAPAPPELTIAITRHTDGSTLLRLTRADGTVTWQRSRGASGGFFPPHDLTHYAVETVLGHRRGFYGLIAEGWDLADFGAPWPRGRLDEADPSELIVGFLDRTGLDDAAAPAAADLNAAAAVYLALYPHAFGGLARWRDLTDGQLKNVRARARTLIAAWHATPPAGSLTLGYTRGAP